MKIFEIFKKIINYIKGLFKNHNKCNEYDYNDESNGVDLK